MTELRRTEPLARDTSEIPRARRVVRAALRDWDLSSDLALLDLVVSELVSNALQHGEGLIELRLIVTDGRVRLEVHDQGHPNSAPHLATGQSVGGWGLRFVDRLADDWGCDADVEGTSVWMSKALDGSDQPTAPDPPAGR